MSNEYRRLIGIMEDVRDHVKEFNLYINASATPLVYPLKTELPKALAYPGAMKAFEEIDDYESIYDTIDENLVGLNKLFKALDFKIKQNTEAVNFFNSGFVTFADAKAAAGDIVEIIFNVMGDRYELLFVDKDGELHDSPQILEVHGDTEVINDDPLMVIWEKIVDRNGMMSVLLDKTNWAASNPIGVTITLSDAEMAKRIK